MISHNPNVISTASVPMIRRNITSYIKKENSDLGRKYTIERCYENTIDQLVYQYGLQLNARQYLPGGVQEDLKRDWGINTYIGTLAAHINASKATTRRHIKKLEEFEFIKTEYVNNRIRIYINPVLIDPVKTGKNHFKIVKICHNLAKMFTSENQPNNKKEFTTCKCLKISESNFDRNNLSPTVVDRLNYYSVPPNPRKFQEARRNVGKNPDIQNTLPGPKLEKIYALCDHANKLYHKPFPVNHPEYQCMMNYFARELNDNNLLQSYQHQRTRVHKWQKFVFRRQFRFTPLPSVFFDRMNPDGFERTRKWLIEDSREATFVFTKNRISSLLRQLDRAANETIRYNGELKTLSLGEKYDFLGTITFQVNGLLGKAQKKGIDAIKINQLAWYFKTETNKLFNKNQNQ